VVREICDIITRAESLRKMSMPWEKALSTEESLENSQEQARSPVN